MGQILNRIFKIAKSYTTPDTLDDANRIINSDDEELKRIIEDLNNYKRQNEKKDAQEKEKNFNYKNKQQQNIKSEMNFELAFRILDIDKNAQTEQIKEAYKKKIKEYHPDKVENLGDELKELARKKTQDINLAYEFLRKAKGF